MIYHILYCVLSVIQGIALNTGILPFSKGRVLHWCSMSVSPVVISIWVSSMPAIAIAGVVFTWLMWRFSSSAVVVAPIVIGVPLTVIFSIFFHLWFSLRSLKIDDDATLLVCLFHVLLTAVPLVLPGLSLGRMMLSK